MQGSMGDDVYICDEAGDQVSELAGEGTDTIQSAIDLTLDANLENLVLTGSAAALGYGNESDNTITGNSADNILNRVSYSLS